MWLSKQSFVALKYVGPLAKNAKLHSIDYSNSLYAVCVNFCHSFSCKYDICWNVSSPWIYLFSPLRFLLAIFFIFNIKPMSRKKRKAKWETEIDLQETKTEQSQRLWRTETNVQNSIKRWCYNYIMYIDFYWFHASLWSCICSVLRLWPLSNWKCFEWPFPRKGCTSLTYAITTIHISKIKAAKKS